MSDTESPLDAYSAAVVRVVQAVGPSVASLVVNGERGREGSGSGVVVGDRILITNAHVADRARRLSASFADGTRMEASVVGVDRLSDLAVLRTADETPPPVSFGDAAALQSGNWSSPSAIRWGWRDRSPREWSADWAAPCPRAAGGVPASSKMSSKPTQP